MRMQTVKSEKTSNITFRLFSDDEFVRRRRLTVLFTIVFAILNIYLFYRENTYTVDRVSLREVVKENIPARIDFQWVDKAQNEARLRERLDNAPKVYLLDEDIGESEKKRLLNDIALAKKALSAENTAEGRMEALQKIWGTQDGLTSARMKSDQLNTLSAIFLNVLDAIYRKGIIGERFYLESSTIPVEIRKKNDNVLVDRDSLIFSTEAADYLRSLIKRYLEADRQYVDFTYYVLKNYLRENVYFSEELTKKRAESIRVNFVPETVTITKGEIIAQKGQIVDETLVDKLHKMEEKLKNVVTLRLIGFMFTLFFMLAVIFLLMRQQGYWTNIQKIFFWSLINFLFFLTFSLFFVFMKFSLYAFPFLAFVIMAYFLIDLKGALISSVFWVVLLAVFSPDFRFSALWLLSSMLFLAETGHFRLRIPTLSTLLKYLTFVLLSLFVVELAAGRPLRESLSVLIWVPVYVMLSFALGYLLVYLFEKVHNITTEVSLNALLSWENPLLRQLMSVAPGTYRHSLIVSELSGDAASAVGADVLLAKVGGLYHDVGKIKRPDYFIENQIYGPNRHDNLLPLMSVRILKNHVEEGVLLGRKNGLGRRLTAIIREHHGTSLIQYFYQKNQKDNKHKHLDEKYFRYDGPKPSGKESAIIFLADKVEAVTRLLYNSPFHHVQERINRIFEEALLDGQLDVCDLTLRDVHAVREAFIEYFRGSRHKRIEYPKEVGGND